MIMYYHEVSYKIQAINLIINLGKELPFYSLDKNKQDTFILVANILFWSFRLFSIASGIALLVTLFLITLYIFIFLEYKLNIIILVNSVIHTYLFYDHILLIITSGVVLLFIMIIFLKWKFDESVKSIKISVLWRNKVRLLDNMMTYNKFTKLVHEISAPINQSIGIIFLITPLLISTALILLKHDPKTLIVQLLHLVILLWLPIPIIFIYLINYFCASIPSRNRSIAKYLYPVFYDKNFHRIQTQGLILFFSYGNRLSNIMIHMKIDSLIARLNKQFVGFHCFNFSKFTRLAMLQFISYLITVYIFLYKLKKNYAGHSNFILFSREN